VSQHAPDREPDPPPGHLRSTGPAPLVVAGVLGLVVGWAIRPVCLRLGYAEPDVSFTAIGGLFFVAAIIGGTAYVTRRTVRGNRSQLAHHQAVNRLVLGKACALAGALVLGGYVGYALAQLGVGDPAADTRFWHSLIAALGAVGVTAAALLLELACRVPDDTE
jgi:hypothetical protein